MRILAHRGSPGTTFVENTVPAVTASLEGGADGLEVDLRLSADGVLVVCHDPDLTRLTGRSLPVGDSSWDELQSAADRCGVPLARVEWVLAAGHDQTHPHGAALLADPGGVDAVITDVPTRVRAALAAPLSPAR